PAGWSMAAVMLLVEVDVEVEVEVDVGIDVDVEVDVEVEVDVGVEVEVEHEVGAVCAGATPVSSRIRNNAAATSMVANKTTLREKPAIVSARTACRWGRPPRPELSTAMRRHIAWCCKAPRRPHSSRRRSRAGRWSSGSRSCR